MRATKLKKTFDLFKKKLTRATEKTSNKKNIAGKIFFVSRDKLLSPEIDRFFRKSATIDNARWAEKNTCFFGSARHKSNARAHLKQRKKHSGLM